MDDGLGPQRIDAYLARLGVWRDEVRPDLGGLTLLHERHLRAVPFESLSAHLRESIVLDVAALVGKLTVRDRGGFCYELNGAFAALLTALGFKVEHYEARVGADGGGMPVDHPCLYVRGRRRRPPRRRWLRRVVPTPAKHGTPRGAPCSR